MRLTKSERKYYKKQLQLKLDSLGVKDETGFKGTGKFKVRVIPNKNFDPSKPLDKKNPPAFKQKVEMMQASNVYRNLIKTLLKQADVEVIEKFLNADIKINPAEEKPQPKEKVIL